MLLLPWTTHTHYRMYSESCTLPKAAEIVDLAVISVDLLKRLRDETTDDEWEKIIDHPLVDELITSLVDLESSIDDD